MQAERRFIQGKPWHSVYNPKQEKSETSIDKGKYLPGRGVGEKLKMRQTIWKSYSCLYVIEGFYFSVGLGNLFK